MVHQIPVDQKAIIEQPNDSELAFEVTLDVAFKRLAIVNVAFIGAFGAGDRQWVLVDTGIAGTTKTLQKAVVERFGRHSRPAAILMTHGHADHSGGLQELAQLYDAPVFAHQLEMPYLNGKAEYPPPDPFVGGGLMSLASPLFSRGPFDVRDRLHPLPEDGSVPFLPGWRWLHTPGHTVGHVSFWRDSDRVILSGDAFISTDQESAYAVTKQSPELHGPPMYYTVDWAAAKASVRLLAELEPEIAVTGHGLALSGPALRASLHELARDFDDIAVPTKGRYVKHPATVRKGNAYRDE